MAVKGYIGDSSVKLNNGNTRVQNGVVSTTENLTSQGYPSSIGTSSGSSGSTGAVRSTSSGGTSGSTGSSSSGSSSTSASTDSMANAYNALLAAYRQNDYSDYLAQMREAAQNAYDRGMSALNSAYDNQMSSLASNLNETKSQLANQYNRSKQNITDDAASSLRQAYINRMLSERNLGQQMSALGLNGGATESTLAGMLNNYGNARNQINTAQNKSLSDLEGNYSDNLSQAMQAYNSAVATANLQKAQQAMSLENALANNQISALGDYQSLLQSQNSQYLDLLKAAIASGANFTFDPTAANNAVQGVSVTQASPNMSTNNYAALQALMNAQQTPGNGAAISLVNTPTTQQNYLANILSQLRG